VVAQVRDQAGAQEAGLADTRVAVEQPGAETLGGDQTNEVVAFAVATEQDVALRSRLWV